MNNQQMIFFGFVFAVGFGVAMLALHLFSPDRVQRRLSEITGTKKSTFPAEENPWVEKVVKVAKPFAKLSLPQDGWEKSPLRTRFISAGWRDPSAPSIYFACKTLLAIGFPLIVAFAITQFTASLSRNSLLMILLLCAAIGYYFPTFCLRIHYKNASVKYLRIFLMP